MLLNMGPETWGFIHLGHRVEFGKNMGITKIIWSIIKFEKLIFCVASKIRVGWRLVIVLF